MATVHAGQLVFTQVTEEESPQGRRGEQTVYCSRRAGPFSAAFPQVCLDRTEEVEIEKRFFYRPPAELLDKHIFFQTRTGKVVVGKVVARVGAADSAGRLGLYFGHALIFDHDEFDRVLEGNPFAVLDADDFHFWSSLEETPENQRDRSSGDLAPVEIAAKPRTSQDLTLLRGLDRGELRQLLLAAAQADDMVQERHAFVLAGDPSHALAMLRELFACLPPPLRRACAFDTLFAGGSLNHLSYWSIGLPAGDASFPANTLVFDLGERRLQRTLDLGPRRSYDRWLARVLAKDDGLERLAKDQAASFDVSRRFDRLLSAGIDRLSRHAGPPSDAALVTEYLEINQNFVDDRLEKMLAHRLGGALTKQRLARLALIKQFPDLKKLSVVEEGVTTPDILSWLDADFHKLGATRPPEQLLTELSIVLKHREPENATDGLAARLKLVSLRWRMCWDELAAALADASPPNRDGFEHRALGTMTFALKWGIRDYKFGVAFGALVECQDAADLPLLELLLGIRSRPLEEDAKSAKPKETPSRREDTLAHSHDQIKLEFSSARRPWLLELAALTAEQELPAPQATNDGPERTALISHCLQMVSEANWKALRHLFKRGGDDFVRAFVAAVRPQLPPFEPCIIHENKGSALFFGAFVPMDPKQPGATLGLLSALLNAKELLPDKSDATSSRRWWEKVLAYFGVDADKPLVLSTKRATDPRFEAVNVASWPTWIQRLHKASAKTTAPAAKPAAGAKQLTGEGS